MDNITDEVLNQVEAIFNEDENNLDKISFRKDKKSNAKIIYPLVVGCKYKNKETGNVVKIKLFANYKTDKGFKVLVIYKDYAKVAHDRTAKIMIAKDTADFCNVFEEA